MNRFVKCSIVLVALFQLTIGCSSTPKIVSERNLAENDYVLATVGSDYSISLPEFHKKLNSSELFGSGGIISSELLRPILDSIVLDTVMGLKSGILDIGKYPDAYRSYKMQETGLMIRSYLETIVYPRISFDSSDVLEYYKTNGGRYYVEEQVFAYNLLVKPSALLAGADSSEYKGLSEEELKQASLLYTQSILDKMKEGRSFPALVGEFSHDEISAREQGSLGWAPRGKYQHPFDSVAFALKKGEVSKPYYDQVGWHVIYVEDYYAEGIPEMTEEIFQLVVQNFVTELSNKLVGAVRDSLLFSPAEMVYNNEIMDSNILKIGGMEWVAIVNELDTVHVFDIKNLELQWRMETGNKFSDRYTKQGFVDQIADDLVLLQHARANSIDTLPQVAPSLYRWRQEYGRNVLWAKMHERSFQPTDSSIKEYYNEHYYEYNSERPYYIQSITVDDSLTALYVRSQASGGADFNVLVEQFSSEPVNVAEENALLRWVGIDNIDSLSYSTVRITPRGGISALQKNKHGFEFFKLVNLFENKNISKVRHLIREILKDEHDDQVYAAFRDKLFEEFDVRMVGDLPSLHLKPFDYR